MNRAQIIGRVGAIPRGGVVNGNCFSNISVATQEIYNDQEGTKVKRTTWHKVVCWGKIAEFCNQYIITGRLILVEGRINHRLFHDDHGISHRVTEIVATRVRALDPKPVPLEEPPVFGWPFDEEPNQQGQ